VEHVAERTDDTTLFKERNKETERMSMVVDLVVKRRLNDSAESPE
jgi:hypothetical protein